MHRGKVGFLKFQKFHKLNTVNLIGAVLHLFTSAFYEDAELQPLERWIWDVVVSAFSEIFIVVVLVRRGLIQRSSG